jgi:hypothetical protein
MGAGTEYDDGITSPLPGREHNVAAGGTGKAPTSPPPVAALLPGMAAERADLMWHWPCYAVGAGEIGGEECWTAARIDGRGHVTAGSPEMLVALIRRDYTADPMPHLPGNVLRDHLLERLRAANPGWAVIAAGGGYRAHRGEDEMATGTLGAMRAQLDNRTHQDRRAEAQRRRA